MKYSILTFLIITFFWSCTPDTKLTDSFLAYIPNNTAVVIKIEKLDSLRNQISNNAILSKMQSWKSYNAISSKLLPLKYITENNNGVLCFSELGKENYEFTYITSFNKNLIQLDSSLKISRESTIYETKKIEKLILKEVPYFLLHINNTSILSSSEVLIENLIRNQGSIKVNPILKRLYNVPNTNKSASIIIHLDKASSLLNPFLKKTSSNPLAKYADWMSLDLKLIPTTINLNGISLANDSIPNYLNLFKNTNALKNNIAELAPLHSEAIQSYSFDDYDAFAKNQQLFLDRSTPMDSLFNTVEEIGYIHLNGQKAIVLNTYGSENIYDYLNLNKKESFDYQGNEILELKNSKLLNNALDPIVKNYDASFCTVLEDAFIFSPTKDLLQTIINKNGATFNKTGLYITSNNTLAEEATALYLSGAKNIEQILKEHCTPTFYKEFKSSNFSKYAFAYQTVVDDNFHHTNINILPIEKEEKTSIVSPLFSHQIENEIVKTPQFVVNHITKKKEVLVQDINNILYLISSTGQILWKKELKGPIQGKVHQVDLYKNKRLQLAFTTNNQFIILDRNGKEVTPFTIDFKDGTLNPLAVFDYEKSKKYRFIVTQGKQIFIYDAKGAIVKGFKFKKASKNIIATPKHFVIKNKDYLVFKLEDGTLKIVNRVGKDRITIKEKIDFSTNEIYVYKNRFNTTDTNGTLHQIDVNGKDTQTQLALVKDHGLVATANTLVYMNDNTLSIRGKKVELDLGVYDKPQLFLINNKIYVSVTDIQNQNIYVFDSQAKLLPNFPVFGTSTIDLADMDGDKKPELVTKDQENSLVVYKIH